MKRVLLIVAVSAVALSGCVVREPYDEHRNSSDHESIRHEDRDHDRYNDRDRDRRDDRHDEYHDPDRG